MGLRQPFWHYYFCTLVEICAAVCCVVVLCVLSTFGWLQSDLPDPVSSHTSLYPVPSFCRPGLTILCHNISNAIELSPTPTTLLPEIVKTDCILQTKIYFALLLTRQPPGSVKLNVDNEMIFCPRSMRKRFYIKSELSLFYCINGPLQPLDNFKCLPVVLSHLCHTSALSCHLKIFCQRNIL